MTRDDVRTQLSAYLDGELGEAERRAVEAALEAEPELRAELDALRRTVRLVRSLPRVAAPAGFRERVEAAIARGDEALRSRPARRWLAAALAAAACLLVAVAALLNRAERPRDSARTVDQTPAPARAVTEEDRFDGAAHDALAQAKPDAALDEALRRQAPAEQPAGKADKVVTGKSFGYAERKVAVGGREPGGPPTVPAAPAVRPHEPEPGVQASGTGLRGDADLVMAEKKREALAERERHESEDHEDGARAPAPEAAKPSATMAAKSGAAPAPAPSKALQEAPMADARAQGGERANREGVIEEARDANGQRRRILERDSLVAAIMRDRAAAAPPRGVGGGQRAVGAAGQATRNAMAGDGLEVALAYTNLSACLAEVYAALDAAEVPYTVQPEGGGRFIVETRLPDAAAKALVARLKTRLSDRKDLEKAEQQQAVSAGMREDRSLFKGKVAETGPAVRVVLHFERAAAPAAEAAPQK
ncbi:MAG TPA: zf-HC2 domain-containing protein [Planctomycetota bacterium]|nr:zf-HC2 domain-containing protein [Planctomycetota bacterium]HRR82336.1 zf-HC2 domain-containing protein [Planctomycetota bacterium]HRT96238.1 zf-HC2 domain-containing protein [Planctomycetota bacterium]